MKRILNPIILLLQKKILIKNMKKALYINDKVKNTLVLIKPLGHNTGYFSPMENANIVSNEFLLVNNIAIGASYAKYKYRNEIKEITIFDFYLYQDIGTEEIIQMISSKIFEKNFAMINYVN